MAKLTKLNKSDAIAGSSGRVFRKLSVGLPTLEQLPAPYGVAIDGDTLTYGDYSALATSFDILVDGVVKATATDTSFDLSALGLADGTYSITVVSKASGYADSNPSEAVSYTVGDSIVGTWVLNQWFTAPTFTKRINLAGDTIGTGNFLDYANDIETYSFYEFYCVSGASFRIISNGGFPYNTYYPDGSISCRNGSDETVYINDADTRTETLRTFTITTNPNDTEFETWLKANATKQ